MTNQRVISRNTTSTELDSDYKWGFTIDIDEDAVPKGLSEDVVRLISAKKNEPEWLLEWRLRAFRFWMRQNYEEPKWANIHHPPIDFQDIRYYVAPGSKKDGPKSLDEVDPEVLEAFNKLGIPLEEQKQLTGVLTTETGARAEPLVVAISTQSSDPNSVMSELVHYGEQVLDGVVDDPSFAAFIYAVAAASR